MITGYIYIRNNDWYKSNNVYKIGITTSIKDRNNINNIIFNIWINNI
jgi:hypothetical protein